MMSERVSCSRYIYAKVDRAAVEDVSSGGT